VPIIECSARGFNSRTLGHGSLDTLARVFNHLAASITILLSSARYILQTEYFLVPPFIDE
jgi:hypothetical protein